MIESAWRSPTASDCPASRRPEASFGGRLALWTFFLVVLELGAPSAGQAIDWEKMVMPGPLVEAHAEYESECSSCHQAFKADAQRTLCLDCHEEVAADLAKQEGFHSKHPLAATGQCRSCHGDHRGRDADIRGLTEATFDHAQTDYPLRGTHQSASCQSCHVPDVARRDAPLDCVACHQEDDAHDGALSEDCGQCHDEVLWTTTRFDHDETDYPLTGAHKTATCGGCHAGDRYKDTPRDCISCHAIDDAHGGRFGSDCGDCHTTRVWRKDGFDHERESGFPLVGAHADATCVTCHRQAPGERTLPESCAGCHASEDVHAGRFGTACGDCHAPRKWDQIRFDHGERTDFQLLGAHQRASCDACHSESVEKSDLDTSCIGCHRSDDVHRGTLGTECASCHDERSFKSGVAFDHGLTKFPLLGLHAMAPCESCHASHDFQRAEVACHACHQPDDKHERTLGDACNRCHNPNGWQVWRFDHDAETDFALDGAHENLACSACHRQPMGLDYQMPQSCVGCHASDDAHRGGFGRECDDCHTSRAWKPASFRRGGAQR